MIGLEEKFTIYLLRQVPSVAAAAWQSIILSMLQSTSDNGR